MTSIPDTARSVRVDPFYISGTTGDIFLTCFRPASSPEPGKAVLCLPPFAEEMNKSRRMLALQGRSLAENDILFVLPDLYGTGDSHGDFGDGNWELWCSDIQRVAAWLHEQGISSVNVLALRSGIFLGLDNRGQFRLTAEKIAMWSPVLSGSTMLNQLLRAKLVRSMGDPDRTSVAESRDTLRKSGGLEIAGFWLSDQLVESIDRLQLEDLTIDRPIEVFWRDVSRARSVRTPAKVDEILQSLLAEQIRVDYSRVTGAQFWLGPEIEIVPELIDSTTNFFTSG